MGGGPTFVSNLVRGLDSNYQLQDQIEGADLMFVPNPMWAERADFEAAKERKIPIVLRLDNIPEDWNNRGTSISKLRDFITWSDKIVYQSEWSKDKYYEFCSSNDIPWQKHEVVRNGVDTKLFKPFKKTSDRTELLFVKSGRNENKRYPEAMEIFRRYWQKNNNSVLYLAGQFADDYHRYNYGFYNKELVHYLGMLNHEVLAPIYGMADVLLFTAYADCAPNTVLEAMSCGTPCIIHPYGGGTEFTEGFKFAVNLLEFEGDYEAMINQALAIDRPGIREHIESNFSLETMCKNYQQVFDVISI